jgi:aryl-alcohol dehydrogenase-like predicted oxidoreductase
MTVPSRALGHSGLHVSAVGLGCNNFGRDDTPTFTAAGSAEVLNAALDAGVTFWDTAELYGADFGLSESHMGHVVSQRRSEIVLATKFGHAEFDSPHRAEGSFGSRAYIRAAIDASLLRLQTDYVDVYQHHTPDPATPIEETLEALQELIDEGKVRHIGHTQYSAEQIRAADSAAVRLGLTRFTSAQDQLNLLERGSETEVLPVVRELTVGFLPFFPLYNGLFTGKFDRNGGPADSRIMRIRSHLHSEAPWDTIEAFAEFCRSRGITMLEGTIGWLLAVPGLSSVIAGATSAEQVQQNAAAADAWTPEPRDFAEISALFG